MILEAHNVIYTHTYYIYIYVIVDCYIFTPISTQLITKTILSRKFSQILISKTPQIMSLIIALATFSLFVIVMISTNLAAISSPTPLNSTQDNLSAYQVLQQYNFPIGLIPEGVSDYELRSDSGEFKVYLDRTCSFPLRNSFTLRYDQTLSAVMSNDRIRDMKGVSVRVLLFWFTVVEVVRISDEQLRFSVGFASSDFQMNYFVESPRCGCGMHCDDKLMSI